MFILQKKLVTVSDNKATLKFNFAEHRIFALGIIVITVMLCFAPRFGTLNNMASIFDGVSLPALLAIGFTITLITGQLDLSIGATATMGMTICMVCQEIMGIAPAIAMACLSGIVIGLINGLLVTRLKIDSFIVTLAMMFIITNTVYLITGGEILTLTSENWAVADTLNNRVIMGLFSWKFVLSLICVVCMSVIMRSTVFGRNLYLIGGNPETAWHSGIHTDRSITYCFILCGFFSSLAGAIFAISQTGLDYNAGPNALMPVIAAVIVGGTSMKGGKGKVFYSLVALITIQALIKGFNCLGAKESVIKIANGLVLGAVILYEAWTLYIADLVKGRRHELLEELNLEDNAGWDEEDDEETQTEENQSTLISENNKMQKNNTTALVCITAIACTAMVSIMAMVLKQQNTQYIPVQPSNNTASAATSAPKTVTKKSVYAILASDGQPLIPRDVEPKKVPNKVANYQSLPKESIAHWHDVEYAGFNMQRTNHKGEAIFMPESPRNGARGKYVIWLKFVDHPYLTAMEKGAQQVVDHYGMKMKVLSANNDTNLQTQQVDQAINEGPDLVIINVVNAKTSASLMRKLNKAGIPVIASNQMPTQEALNYCLAWTGPDDWGNMRNLSKIFAKGMNYEGKYAIVRHFEGNACFNSRTWSFISELKKIAPKMECVEMGATKLDKAKTQKVVAGWLKLHKDLKGIISSDDSGAQLGINEACDNANRTDIIRIAAGNSKVGMDAIKEGKLLAINYQSAESDGAFPMKLAADWFEGKEFKSFIQYLPKVIIDKDNVESFYPAQW